MPTDPVCGMFVPDTSNLKLTKDGRDYFFCSTDCLNKFKSPEEQVRAIRWKLTVAWLFSVPVLALTYIPGIAFKPWILLVLTLPVQFYSGIGFYRGAYESIRNRMGNMDILITLGTLTAFFYSFVVTFDPLLISHSSTYYDASAFIITLILTGNFIETITKKSAGDAASKLLELIPGTAHKVVGDDILEVPSDSIKEGDTVLVKPGEILSADGVVSEGSADVDASTITGEQEPVLATVGSRVISGTKNLNGTLKIKVLRSGSNSTIRKIYDMLQTATSGRARIQRIADVFSLYFVPVVLIAASISAALWVYFISVGQTGQWDIPVLAFVSVVVIACPCAIGLAAPITMLISSTFSYENGLIVKNTGALDRISRVTRVIFDKTGTLTRTLPEVSEIHSSIDQDQMIAFAGTVEKYSNHPVAQSIVRYAVGAGISLSSAIQVKETPGQGIQGTVSGKTVEIIRSKGSQNSAVEILLDGKNVGNISFRYVVRPESALLIRELRERGIKTTIVTGDKETEAHRISEMLSLDSYHSQCLPEQKAEIVRKYQEEGDFVVFVGDGINDTVAMETADAGIAVPEASDVAKEAGDVIIAKNNIMLVLSSIDLSRQTIRKVKQNIFWAIGYNSALIPVAGGALVPFLGLQVYSVLPILSALAMGMSSTSVVLNSLLLRGTLRKKVFNRTNMGTAV